MLTELKKKTKKQKTKKTHNNCSNKTPYKSWHQELFLPNRGPSQLSLARFLAFWLAQNPGMNAAFHMLPTVCFSSLPILTLTLLPQTFLRLSSLHMTLHSQFRSYKVSHHPLRYCYKISVIMTHYAAITHRVRVCTHMPICFAELWNHYAFATPHLHKY